MSERWGLSEVLWEGKRFKMETHLLSIQYQTRRFMSLSGPHEYHESWGDNLGIPSFQTPRSTCVGWFGQSKRTSTKLENLFWYFCGILILITGEAYEGVLFLIHSIHSIDTEPSDTCTGPYIVCPKFIFFWYIILFFSHYDAFKPEAEHKDRHLSEYKTLPERSHMCRWHCLQAQRKKFLRMNK